MKITKNSWEEAVNKFLSNYNNKKIIGVVVCGSYITGNPSKFSDIDLQIILEKGVSFRERGTKKVDGFLIEYFVNPVNYIPVYFKEDFNARKKISSHMLATGKVLFDKTGEIKKLVAKAKRELQRTYPVMKKKDQQLTAYTLWDKYDNLCETYERDGEEFYIQYYLGLRKIISSYTAFLRIDDLPEHKITRFLKEKQEREKYLVKEFPDKKFEQMLLSSLKIKAKKKMLLEYKQINDYVINRLGGINTVSWSVRT